MTGVTLIHEVAGTLAPTTKQMETMITRLRPISITIMRIDAEAKAVELGLRTQAPVRSSLTLGMSVQKGLATLMNMITTKALEVVAVPTTARTILMTRRGALMPVTMAHEVQGTDAPTLVRTRTFAKTRRRSEPETGEAQQGVPNEKRFLAGVLTGGATMLMQTLGRAVGLEMGTKNARLPSRMRFAFLDMVVVETHLQGQNMIAMLNNVEPVVTRMMRLIMITTITTMITTTKGLEAARTL